MNENNAQAQEQPANYVDLVADAVWGREPQRDEQGRFAKSEQPVAEQPLQTAQEPIASENTKEQEAEKNETAPKEDTETIELDPDEKFIEIEEVLENGEKGVNKYSLNELKAQRLMRADYTRKTQELAQQRKELEQKNNQSIENERKQYLSTLQTLHKAVINAAAPELQNVNWSTLATENPAEYVRLSNRAREVQASIAAIQQEHDRVYQSQNADREKQRQSVIEEAKVKIKEAIPDWNDALYQKVMNTAVKYGYTQQEAAQLYDPKVITLLHKLSLSESVSEQKPIIEKKLVLAPKVVKPGARVSNKAQTDANAAKQRLSQSGSINDLADVMGQFLK
jgi:hypothetical protein